MMVSALVLHLALASFVQTQPTCDRVRAEDLNQQATRAAAGIPRLGLARQAVEACATLASAHNTLGTALEETDDLDGAVSAYETAARLAPEWTIPVLGLGDIARRRKDWATAEAHYLRAQMIAREGAEVAEVTRAFDDLRAERERAGGASGEYAFKDSRGLGSGLQLDRADAEAPVATRGFGPATSMSSEYVVSPQGITANLTIRFGINSAELLPDGQRQLDEVGRAIKAGQPGIAFLIEGHSSSEGSAERNNQLSRERAAAARDYLVSRFSLSASRFEVRGLGASQPVMNGAVENRTKSRRVALIRKYSGG